MSLLLLYCRCASCLGRRAHAGVRSRFHNARAYRPDVSNQASGEDERDGIEKYGVQLGDVNRSPQAIRYSTPAIGKVDFSVMIGVGEREGDGMAGGLCYPPCQPPPCPPCPWPPAPFGVVPDVPEVSRYQATDELWGATSSGMTIGSTVQDIDGHASVQVGYHYANSNRGTDIRVWIPHEYPTGDMGYRYDLGGDELISAGDDSLPPVPVPVPPPLPRF